MKKLFFTSIFNFILLSGYSQSNIDVLHYKFNIGLNDVNDTIYGLAEINVKFLNPATEVFFDFTKTGPDGKGMTIAKVEGTGVRSWLHQQEKLRITLSQTKYPGDSANFIIHYSGIPADGLIIAETKYGRRGFFADNWPDRGHNWIPCHEDPADKAKLDFIVTAPEHYQVVANGIKIEETSLGNGFKLTHWKEDVPIPPKVMVIGVADFAVNLSEMINDCIPVYSWVYPENKEDGFYDYGQAGEILLYYINTVGPYGYKKLANVQSKTRFGGLENANTIFYSENSVTGTRRSEGLLAHEIAHQWFGNMATEKSFGHLWLSEGFATYFTILYFENKYGRDTAIKMLKEDRDQVIEFAKKSDKTIVDTLETDYMNLLNVNSYQKGGWVLHMLRSELGDSVFWQSVRKYYATYAGSSAGSDDLKRVFEEVSGKNLDQFFHQWLYSPGLPDLNISWKYNESEKQVYIDIKQVQKNIFQFPLLIRLTSVSGKNIYKKVIVDKASVTTTIPFPEKARTVTPDPDTESLIRFSVKEKK